MSSDRHAQIRISGDLARYVVIIIAPVLRPDFNREHLFARILGYQRRERRFGGGVAN